MLFCNLSLSDLDNFLCLLMESRSIQYQLVQYQGSDILRALLTCFLRQDLFSAQQLGNLQGCSDNRTWVRGPWSRWQQFCRLVSVDADLFWKKGEASKYYPIVSSVSGVSSWQFRCYVCWWQRNVFLVFSVVKLSLNI